MTHSPKLLASSSFAALALCATLTLAPSTALAQIDEIVTTAQRTEQNLQEVPVAVTVLTGEDLDVKQINDTLDLQSFVPNLNIGTNTGTANAPRIFLRGIGEDESRGAVEPAVGTYIDGVYIGRLVGSLLDLVDLEQVEVLRGPQGTLYGRNSNGGAIKISSVKPQQETSASGRFTFGNFDRFDARGMVNFAPSDTTAIRVSGLYKERDGFIDFNPTGNGISDQAREDINQVETLAFRGAISQDIGNWNILIAADYTDDDSDPVPSSIIDSIDADGDIFTVEPAPGTSCLTQDANAPAGPFQFTRPVGCFGGFSNETKSQGISGTITGELGDFTVQSISSFRKLNDDLSSHIGFPFAQQTDQDQLSQEITLASNLGGALNYVVGAFYYKEDLELDTAFVFPFNLTSDTESFAVFGQADYAITDRATLTGGLRYTDESRDFTGVNLGSETGNGDFTRVEDTSDSNVSYTVKLDYDLTDDLMVYGSYATGFKGSGFSPDCFSPAACFQFVEEEKVATIEFGLRSQIWENRLQFNATYFNNQYDNLQIAASVPGLGFTRFNVDETQIQGFEFDVLFRPTERFTLSANLGLLDPEYQELDIDQAGGLTNNGVPCAGGVVTIQCALDLELKNAPEYKANIAAVYDQPFATGTLSFSGDISFEADSFNLVANSPLSAETDIPTLVNGRIAFTPDDSFWNVSLWAKNILDEEYFRAGTGTGNAVYPSEPATYGVDVGFNF